MTRDFLISCGKVMSGKLIVLEGLDGSGKSTQLELIKKYLENNCIDVRHIKLPDYNNKSSELVKMYLSGEFGQNAGAVNPYAASLFYAVDRFASFSRFWSDDYFNGKVIIADRYTTSNAIYQMSKMPENEWDKYLQWLEDTEYVKLDIPRPNLTIYLDVEPEISQNLMTKRYFGDESKKDIHERNVP